MIGAWRWSWGCEYDDEGGRRGAAGLGLLWGRKRERDDRYM
jgi:hypothetical protein